MPRTNISVIYKDAAGIPITTDSITKYDIQAGAIDYELPYVSSANVQKIDPAQTAISVNISTSSSYRKYYTQYVNAVSQSSADGKLFVTYTSTAPCKLTIRGYVFYRDATGVVVAHLMIYQTLLMLAELNSMILEHHTIHLIHQIMKHMIQFHMQQVRY